MSWRNKYYNSTFHPTCGQNIRLSNTRKTATCTSAEQKQRFLFSALPIQPGQMVNVKLLTELPEERFGLGFTTLDPGDIEDLQDFHRLKLDRNSWSKDVQVEFAKNSVVSFWYKEDGQTGYRLDDDIPKTFTWRHFNAGLRIWALMYLRGNGAKVLISPNLDSLVDLDMSAQQYIRDSGWERNSRWVPDSGGAHVSAWRAWTMQEPSRGRKSGWGDDARDLEESFRGEESDWGDDARDLQEPSRGRESGWGDDAWDIQEPTFILRIQEPSRGQESGWGDAWDIQEPSGGEDTWNNDDRANGDWGNEDWVNDVLGGDDLGDGDWGNLENDAGGPDAWGNDPCGDDAWGVSSPRGSNTNPWRFGSSTNNSLTDNEALCKICYNAKIDSVVYRCGHACMCMTCAETLWDGKPGSGNCPICKGPIIDVIKFLLVL